MKDSPATDSSFYYRYERQDTALSVCSAGHEKNCNGYRWGPAIRFHYYSIQHVVSGEGLLRQCGREYIVRPGDTFVSFPDRSEELVSLTKEWELFWVGFSGTEAPLIMKKLGISEASPILYTGVDDEFIRLQNQIYQARGQHLSDSFRMTGHLYLLFAHLMKKMGVDQRSNDTDVFKSALNYLSEHALEPCSIDELCQAISISRSQLYRIFIKHMGKSPMQYILHQRITRSCYYLENSQMSINEISYAVGYSDPLYYSRIFRKNMGCSPSQYRRKQAVRLATDSCTEDNSLRRTP